MNADWPSVYEAYRQQHITNRTLATHYLAHMAELTHRSLISNESLVVWTGKELSLDILVGGTNCKFILLHNVKAFNNEDGMQVVGISGHSF
jgi:hypothetical protein